MIESLECLTVCLPEILKIFSTLKSKIGSFVSFYMYIIAHIILLQNDLFLNLCLKTTIPDNGIDLIDQIMLFWVLSVFFLYLCPNH